MFTGIVEGLGEVVSVEATEAGARIVLALAFAGELEAGQSVAVNGCCLTVAGLDRPAGTAAFDLLGETLRVTNLGGLCAGDRANVERALRAGERMGGHFVQGHVDCVSRIRALERRGGDHRLEVDLPQNFARYVAHRGSIAVDGISLTVAELGEDSFAVWIIPHTFAVTNLQGRRVGDPVNLEFDILAKYVERGRESPNPISK